MEGVLQFFEQLNEELYRESLDYLSSSGLDEKIRNMFLIRLHLISLDIEGASLSTRLVDFLMQLRMSQAMKYGNSFIRPNFISLQTLKILQLTRETFLQLNGMSDEAMNVFLVKYLDNDCFYNDNNDISGGDYLMVEDAECRKCKSEKIEIHESFEGKLNICSVCCYSWKAFE